MRCIRWNRQLKKMKICKIIRQINLYIIILFFCLFGQTQGLPLLLSVEATTQDNYPVIGKIENILFGKPSSDLKISDRISAIEKNIFGKTYSRDPLDVRTERLKANVLGDSENLADTEQEFQNNNNYENLQTVEVSSEQFQDILYQFINEERSFKGLLPLVKDETVLNVAFEQAKEILAKDYLSYSNLKNQYPDERYTLAGGTGAIIEVVKGFEKKTNEKKVKLTELLAKQLVQAIEANPDDSQILYSSYINHCGFGFALSNDKKKFVSVIEFVTKEGEFEPIKPLVSFGEKLRVVGKVKLPYKFKAISVAYYDSVRLNVEDENNSPGYFTNESLKPYFPPQDYIAYSNTAKNNFVKIIKGIGVIGAIGAAPFTGGASAIFAPVLISSIQNGPPKEIPLKGGIKVNGKGEFSGEVELNYQGKSGLYYVSVLAERPGVNFPIVVSRRTVRVSSFMPAAEGDPKKVKSNITLSEAL